MAEPSSPEGLDDSAEDGAFQVPKEILDALGGFGKYSVGHARGPTAIGDNARAFELTVETQHRECWPIEVDSTTVTDTLTRFVACGSDADLTERLETRRLVCLVGDPNTGRKHSAVVALADRYGMEQIVRLESATDDPMASLVRDSTLIKPEWGHYLETPAAALKSTHLQKVEAIARQVNATVIVIANKPPETSGLGLYVVEHRVPDAVEVFESHLRHHFRDLGRCNRICDPSSDVCGPDCASTYMSQILEHPQVIEHLRRSGTVVGLAVNQAVRLAKQCTDLSQLQEFIDEEQADRSLDTARAMLRPPEPSNSLDRGKQVYQQAFRIAYAAFVGGHLSLVIEAAETLMNAMAPGDTDTPSTNQFDHFGQTVDHLIPDDSLPNGTGAESRLRHDQTVTFRDSGMARRVLEVAWQEYPAGRRILLSWLDELAADRRTEVRQRAAVTAAYFASFDRQFVFGYLIDQWAKSWRARSRNAAALACVLIATTEDYEPRAWVTQQVYRWATRGTTRQRDTAIATYAAGLSDLVPIDLVVTQLRAIIVAGVPVRLSMVSLALKRLIESGAEAPVVTAMGDWLEESDPELGMLVAWGVVDASQLLHRSSSAVMRPALMSWAGDDEQRRQLLAKLWCHALLVPSMAFHAWSALGSWVLLGTQNDDLGHQVFELLKMICRDEIFRKRTKFYLAHVWTITSDQNPLIRRLTALLEGDDHARLDIPV